MKNVRPIYNLLCISTLSENVVSMCIEEQLEQNDLHDSYKSAYRGGYSTETALLKVHSDSVEDRDKGSMTALIVLDLTITFHVIDLSDTTEALRSFLCHQQKGQNLGKVAPQRTELRVLQSSMKHH